MLLSKEKWKNLCDKNIKFLLIISHAHMFAMLLYELGQSELGGN